MVIFQYAWQRRSIVFLLIQTDVGRQLDMSFQSVKYVLAQARVLLSPFVVKS